LSSRTTAASGYGTEDQLELIAAEADGAKCQMNDCVSDPAGRLYAGSQYYDPSGKYELGKLMRMDVDGKVTIVEKGFDLSNGLAFSLDHTTLYFADSVARRIYGYDYDVRTGNLRHRRVLVQVPSKKDSPMAWPWTPRVFSGPLSGTGAA
jgi:sugar lactone lactonase YvrE